MTDGAGRHHRPHLGLEGQNGHPSRAQWRGGGSLEKGESGRGPAEGAGPLPPPCLALGHKLTPSPCLWLCAHSPSRPGFGALTARFWAPGRVWGARGAGPTLLLGATKGDRCSAQRAAGLCRLHPPSFTLRTFPELPCLGPCHPHSDSPQD